MFIACFIIHFFICVLYVKFVPIVGNSIHKNKWWYKGLVWFGCIFVPIWMFNVVHKTNVVSKRGKSNNNDVDNGN
jgi:hypothetical protein